VSETELRHAAKACVDSLERRRPHLAKRVGERLDQLLGVGETDQALALMALFGPRPD
jgi:hypothetical protein